MPFCILGWFFLYSDAPQQFIPFFPATLDTVLTRGMLILCPN